MRVPLEESSEERNVFKEKDYGLETGTRASTKDGSGYQNGSHRDPSQHTGAKKHHYPGIPATGEFVIEFSGPDDPEHPQNWPMLKRLFLASLLMLNAFMTAYNSSTVAAVAPHLIKEFGIGHEVTALGTTLFILGFFGGPVFWGPVSELVGRRWPLAIGIFGFGVFALACATAKDTQTLMLSRFFAGLFGSGSFTLIPASFSDIFNNIHRGIAISIYASALFAGPYAGSFIGSYIADSYLGWRWSFYIPAIVTFFIFGIIVLVGHETYPPIVLVRKAAFLRRQTQNWLIYARREREEFSMRRRLLTRCFRPFVILFTEPLVFLITLYMSFMYGLSYALLGAYPVVFHGVHGMTGGDAALPFIGLIVGLALGNLFMLAFVLPYSRKLKQNHDIPVPEWRLPQCIFGGVVFAAGLFWLGWTGYSPSTHVMVPTAAGVFIGFGIITVFMQCFNYLLDCYLENAASTFAANLAMRSIFGATFPLFAGQMFENLGIQWAGTLLACIASVLVPIPIAFYIWGPNLRQRSRLASVVAETFDTDGLVLEATL